jgi:Zn-finger nucleic acid-binding protein
MAYRDERDRCPRCGIDLTDAVVGIACTQCRGLWIAAGDVAVMAATMQTPPIPVPLPLVDDPRRELLPCPSCRESMVTRKLYDVPIDLCTKHGIWFDAHELGMVLFRAARRPVD